MKRLLCILLCVLMLLPCALPALAADGVPREVMEATRSVVRILSEYRKGASTGSGFVIKNDGEEILIATNNHVVDDDPKRISVWVSENRQVDAEIVFTTSAKDLCVLRLTEFVDMAPLTLSKEAPQHGGAIYAVGYPGAGDVLSDTQAHTSDSVTITDGIISAIRTFTIEKGAEPVKLLQVNAAINSGNSGGPLFNTKGQVIGVNTYKVNVDSQGVFGSVDISELWNLLEEHNIDIVEETLPTEAAETTEPVPEEAHVPAFLLPVAIGVVVLILPVVLITGRKKKKTARAAAGQKPRTTALKDYMAAYPEGMGIGGAVALLLPVAIRLRNLHNDGRLHLQVCPENIQVGAEGALLKEPTGQESGRFNNGFAAPEIYRGAGFGITSDVYSFAALLLYAATGKVPANSLQPEALEQDFMLLDNPGFADILRRAMASGTAERIQSMQELIYGSAVYNVPVQEKQTAKAAVAVPEKAEQPAPVREEKREIPKPRKQAAPKKKAGKLIPIAAVLACAIAVTMLWNPMEKQKDIPVSEEQESAPLTPEAMAYAEAEQLLAAGETGKAAIAFGKLGDYKDARARSFALWDETVERKTIFADNGHLGYGTFTYFGVKADGTIAGHHFGGNLPIWEEVYGWTDIVDLSYRDQGMILGLKEDGTVLATGYDNYYGELDVSGWTDIVEVCAEGYSEPNVEYEKNSEGEWITIGNDKYYSVGLKSDGTVVATGNNQFSQCEVSDWTDIVAITTYTYREESYLKYRRGGLRDVYSYSRTFGIRADGTVLMTGEDLDDWCDLSGWTDIIAISVSDCHVVGLKSDGTVVTVGYNPSVGYIESERLDVSDWENVEEIHTNVYSTTALTADGTFLFAGNPGMHNPSGRKSEWTGWTDIVSLQSADYNTLGLKSDGTVIYWGGPNGNVSQWKNVISVCCTESLSLGLKSDGTVVSASYQDSPTWSGIALPGQRKLKAPETKTGEAPTDIQAGYDAAENLLAQGENAKAAIAFGKLGDYKDARQRSFALWREVIPQQTISAGFAVASTVAALTEDGTVLIAGSGDARQMTARNWTDIISIGISQHHTVGLKADGTVLAIGATWGGMCEVSDWKDIIAIAATAGRTIGLKSDGTVVAVGTNSNEDCNVSEWKDIVAISAGVGHTVGLKSDGTVVAVGAKNCDYGQLNVDEWTDIIAISAGTYHTVGLKSDGTVLATGTDRPNRYGVCVADVANWNDIIAVAAGGGFTAGLKKDGTVVFAGEEYKKYDVSGWSDVVSIAAGAETILGLKSDGALVFTGACNGGSDLINWTGIRLPN